MVYAVGGRWTRFPGAGLAVAVGLIAWTMLDTNGLKLESRLGTLARLNAPATLWVSDDGPDTPHWVAGGSPAWYLVYITLLCGLAASAAMLHEASAQRPRLVRWLAVLAVLALASLALAAAADPTRSML